MGHKEQILSSLNSNVTEMLKGKVDERDLIMEEDLVHRCTEIVIYNIAKTHDEKEIDVALDRVSGNVANFIGLVVIQLIDFGSGRNQGPFMDMFDRLLLQQCQIS